MGIDNQYATGKKALGVAWVDEISYDSKEIIMVGDTVHDSEVAEAMAIDCVLVECVAVGGINIVCEISS